MPQLRIGDITVMRANKKMWMVWGLKNLGADDVYLVDIYTKQIRSILELAAPAWHGGINQAERLYIEKIQKSAAHITLGED